MKNKTCGECKHFEVDEIAAGCEKHYIICDDDAPACEHFKAKVITNGDKIMHGGNKALAEFHGKLACDVCAYRYDHRCIAPQGKPLTCVDGIEEWLNAPAESEGKDE